LKWPTIRLLQNSTTLAYFRPNMTITEPRTISEIIIEEAVISLKSDGIIYVYINSNVEINLELQMRMYGLYHQITGGKLTPFLFKAGEAVSVTKEARDNALKIEETSPCKAMGVIANNIAYRLIANFYLKVNKPKRPYRIFSNEQEAVEWLKTLV